MQFFHPEKMWQWVGALRKSKTIEQIYQFLGVTLVVEQWAGCWRSWESAVLNNLFRSYFKHFDVISDGCRKFCVEQRLKLKFLVHETVSIQFNWCQHVRLSEEKKPAGAHPFELGTEIQLSRLTI